jgi:hypothetical protein
VLQFDRRYTTSATDSANEQDEPARADDQEFKRKSLKVISALDWHKERHGSMERPSFANNIVHIAAVSSHTRDDLAASAEAALLGAHSSWEPDHPKEETKQATAAAPFVNDASSVQPADANSDATQPKQGEGVERWWKWWFNAAVKKKEKVTVLLEHEQADDLASKDFPCKLDEHTEQHTEGADQRPPLVHASNYRGGDHYRQACIRPVAEAAVELFPPGKLFHLVSNGIREESLGGRILVVRPHPPSATTAACPGFARAEGRDVAESGGPNDVLRDSVDGDQHHQPQSYAYAHPPTSVSKGTHCHREQISCVPPWGKRFDAFRTDWLNAWRDYGEYSVREVFETGAEVRPRVGGARGASGAVPHCT